MFVQFYVLDMFHTRVEWKCMQLLIQLENKLHTKNICQNELLV